MKIRLIICTLLIAFLGNVAFARIVRFSFADNSKSIRWFRPSVELVVEQNNKIMIIFPQKFSLKRSVKYKFITSLIS
jgi:hypothetical protein